MLASDLQAPVTPRHVPELDDIDVEHLAWGCVFVAADRFSSDPADVAQPGQETMKSFAASLTVQWWSTTNGASFKRAYGVNIALAWDTKAS
jgi:hypothetical protein